MPSRLYIGNLSFDATEAELRAHFAPYYPTSVKIITERETGRSRGFAFMDVKADPNEVISTCDGQDFLGRALRVSAAASRNPNAPQK